MRQAENTPRACNVHFDAEAVRRRWEDAGGGRYQRRCSSHSMFQRTDCARCTLGYCISRGITPSNRPGALGIKSFEPTTGCLYIGSDSTAATRLFYYVECRPWVSDVYSSAPCTADVLCLLVQHKARCYASQQNAYCVCALIFIMLSIRRQRASPINLKNIARPVKITLLNFSYLIDTTARRLFFRFVTP